MKEYFVGNCAACKKPMFKTSEDMRLKIRPDEWLKHEEDKIVFLNGLGYHRDCLLTHVKFPSRPVSFIDHSTRELPQQAIVKGHMITVVSRVGRMKAGEFSFPIVDWLLTDRHASPNWAKQALLRELNTNLDPEGIPPERLFDSQRRAIDGALKLYTQPASRIKNPNDYNLRQYTIGEDGTATFVARIKIEIHAKRKNAILEYMDWLLKLPGVTLRIREERGSGLRLRWKDTETEGHEKPIRDIDIFIDADSNRYTLTNDVINDVLEDFDSRITDRLTLMQFLDKDTGGAWQGNNLVLYTVTVTSKSMRRLNAFMQNTWPTAESKDQLRYHRDPKQRRFIDTDFGVWLFLDGPEPKYVNSYNLPWSMNPIRHTTAGWYWGNVGPQPTRGKTVRQMKAIFASGYRGH